jgi:hypothetical protein
MATGRPCATFAFLALCHVATTNALGKKSFNPRPDYPKCFDSFNEQAQRLSVPVPVASAAQEIRDESQRHASRSQVVL